MSNSLAIVLLVVASACTPPAPLVSSAPIGVTVGDAGLPLANGSLDGVHDFPLLVDTGTVLTAHSSPGTPHIAVENLTLLDAHAPPVARAVFQDVNVLESPLGLDGAGAAALDLSTSGILGGDLLQSFAVALDYSAPSVSLLPGETACSCAVADACKVAMGFQLAGGGTLELGGDVYTYPATRVTVRACLEPVSDPLATGPHHVACAPLDPKSGLLPCGYTPLGSPGVDAQLLVATGFPGVLLGASLYDRLCTEQPEQQCINLGAKHDSLCAAAPTAKALLAGLGTAEMTDLHFADGSTAHAAKVTLGDPAHDLASMVLVGGEALLGPCAELARSRRLRDRPPSPGSCDDPTKTNLTANGCLQVLPLGGGCGDPNHCDDRTEPAAAYVELDDPIDVWVVDDNAPVLQGIDTDAGSLLPTIQGIVGTALLRRLSTEIDYPNRRIIASCVDPTTCRAYPRYACASGQSAVGDCGPNGGDAGSLCNPPSSINPAVACEAAPIDQ